MTFHSLVELIAYRALWDREKLYVSSPDSHVDLTYGLFYRQAQKFARHLQGYGLPKGARVALSLNNGLGWLTAFWGVLLAGGSVVPLNPRLKPQETAGLLAQAGVRMIIADTEGQGSLPPEQFACRAGSCPVEMEGQEELHLFLRPGRAAGEAAGTADRSAEAEALLLFTSGSTGEPKGVALTHGNLLAEAGFIQQGHALTGADIVLCILPFFHINGLVITLITPVLTGSRAVVPRKFSAKRFWTWIDRYQVTWFSAVPTILSILLSQKGEVAASSLRFVRSASASLPVVILEEFERRFGVPVIESYGISEAGSQVATNPLPPAVRKAGSVGLPVGNELLIVDESGQAVPAGVAGEVIIRGPNVTKGYHNNAAANRESFKDDWFYTGDLGFFDQEGYLFLTGRRKELINRAGEKISPREVDEILYRLPAVETAAAVGVPDRLFGEEIVAFIQLRPGSELSGEQVLAHCRALLADFKVPKQIFFITSFPKGASGKIQRLRLVELYHDLTVMAERSTGRMTNEPVTRGKYNVRVDEQACKGCGYCAEVCPREVFGRADYFNGKGYRPAQVKAAGKCVGCRRCFFLCPDFAIDVAEKREEDEP
ncbi:MAG TPA: AMP-binding protein [Negativicutes bacterium]|nr:AMP-binding protein [Negativicutes bacterium]